MEISYCGDYTNASTGDDGIAATTNCQYMTVQNCNIHHNGDDGIHLAPAEDSYIQFNLIHHSAPDAGDVHPDGIATNATSNFNCTIRFNKIYDNRNPTDLEHINMEMYGNLIYDTSVGSPGNHGIRVKLGVTGKIYNNIVAWNNAGIYAYADSGVLDVQNNIFWENADQSDYAEIKLNTGDTSKYNIFKRTDLNPRNKIINYAGTEYTLAEYQAAALGPGTDNGIGSLAKTPSGSDWGTTQVFDNETRGSQDFTPHSVSSPQVNAGTNLGSPYDKDISKVARPQGAAWDIGAYEYDSGEPEVTDGTTWGDWISAQYPAEVGKPSRHFSMAFM
jgi:hypothetical protein